MDPNNATDANVVAEEAKDGDNEELKAISEPVAQSYKCSDCGKPLRNEDERDMHAARSKHTNFVACEDEMKPLDEEAKKEQHQRVQDLLAQKRLDNEEKGRKDVIQKEKKRRADGKEISKLRENKEEFDRQKLMDDLKRDKLQKKMARDHVLENIRRDRIEIQEREKLRIEAASSVSNVTVADKPASVSATEQSNNMADKDYSECKLLIRLPTGESLKGDFNSKESLSFVRDYVMTKWSKDDNSLPNLFTAFPRKVYTPDDMDMSLLQLGLAPTAVIHVS